MLALLSNICKTSVAFWCRAAGKDACGLQSETIAMVNVHGFNQEFFTKQREFFTKRLCRSMCGGAMPRRSSRKITGLRPSYGLCPKVVGAEGRTTGVAHLLLFSGRRGKPRRTSGGRA